MGSFFLRETLKIIKTYRNSPWYLPYRHHLSTPYHPNPFLRLQLTYLVLINFYLRTTMQNFQFLFSHLQIPLLTNSLLLMANWHH